MQTKLSWRTNIFQSGTILDGTVEDFVTSRWKLDKTCYKTRLIQARLDHFMIRRQGAHSLNQNLLLWNWAVLIIYDNHVQYQELKKQQKLKTAVFFCFKYSKWINKSWKAYIVATILQTSWKFWMTWKSKHYIIMKTNWTDKGELIRLWWCRYRLWHQENLPRWPINLTLSQNWPNSTIKAINSHIL